MKNIKLFKFWDSYEFDRCLKDYGYTIDDVVGFSVVGKKHYHGNILKVYSIWFKDCGEEYFKVVYFKSFNECNQCRLGLKGNKLLRWYQISNIKHYKLCGEYILE